VAHDSVPEIKLVSHSNVVYWWPAWVTGYAIALYSYFYGHTVTPAGGPLEPGAALPIVAGNNPGLLFIGVLLLLIIFTNAKLRGIYSVLTIVTLAFFSVLFAWLGWWDDILEFIPNLSARANAGFYFVFATALLTVWLLGFFVFDRLTYWRVRPGQLLEERLIGGSAHSHDTNGLLFEKKEQDFFRHVVLGVGAGDLQLTTKDLRSEVIDIPNVLLVDRKVNAIARMIAVKPEHAAEAKPGEQPVHHDKAA
jgi:hypothetical protein